MHSRNAFGRSVVALGRRRLLPSSSAVRRRVLFAPKVFISIQKSRRKRSPSPPPQKKKDCKSGDLFRVDVHKELKDCGVGHVFVVSLFQIQLHDDGLRFAAAAAAIVIILFPPTMVVVFYSVRFCHCWRVYFIFGANGNPLLVENIQQKDGSGDRKMDCFLVIKSSHGHHVACS